jgi:hypothetical protein
MENIVIARGQDILKLAKEARTNRLFVPKYEYLASKEFKEFKEICRTNTVLKHIHIMAMLYMNNVPIAWTLKYGPAKWIWKFTKKKHRHKGYQTLLRRALNDKS